MVPPRKKADLRLQMIIFYPATLDPKPRDAYEGSAWILVSRDPKMDGMSVK